MMTMIRTTSVLLFFLGLNGVGALDGLGVVDEDCADLAKEGTSQCQDWVQYGECESNPEFMHRECRMSCGLCTKGGLEVATECVDEEKTRQCHEWAWHGECDNNPEYMYNYCRRSCGLCPPGSLESLLFCEDEFDDQCDKWVEDGLCVGTWNAKKGQHTINSAYVVEFCPKSCNVCDIHLDSRDFSLNLGLPQSAPDINDKQVFNQVKSHVAAIRDYVQRLEPELQEVCKMAHPFCARFALSKDCEDHADSDMMKYMCAASCQTCELLRGDKEGMNKAKTLYAQALLDNQKNKQTS